MPVEIPQQVLSRMQQHIRKEIVDLCKKEGVTNILYTKVGIVERDGRMMLYVKIKPKGKIPYELLDKIAKLMRMKYTRKILVDSPHLYAIRLSGELRKEVFKRFKK
ncbi:MAG: hypothetical protein DRN04_00705 [Thermoprotei archaeon]|nr:MAG: hypothetical protein DRN04_00705 [Thermoprotei archaeon]